MKHTTRRVPPLDDPIMSVAASLSTSVRSAKLDALHAQHLKAPPTSQQAKRAREAYAKVAKAKQDYERTLAKELEKQKEISERKRLVELEARHAYNRILEVSAELKAVALQVDKEAERLVLTHGSAPLELDGVTYDFGCYGERVWLVPRPVRRRKR